MRLCIKTLVFFGACAASAASISEAVDIELADKRWTTCTTDADCPTSKACSNVLHQDGEYAQNKLCIFHSSGVRNRLTKGHACADDSDCQSPLMCRSKKLIIGAGELEQRKICSVMDVDYRMKKQDEAYIQGENKYVGGGPHQPQYVAVINHDPDVTEEQGQIKGKIVFQRRGTGGVIIVVELATSSPTATIGHSVHVHVSPVDFTGKCSTTGGHYDPTKQETVDDYKCDAKMPLHCYAGDLTGKHGKITVQPMTAYSSVRHEDPNLNFNDLNGRGVVIHMKDGGKRRMACGTITIAMGGVYVFDKNGGDSTSVGGGLGHARACHEDSQCQSPLTCQQRDVMVEDNNLTQRRICWKVETGLEHGHACHSTSQCQVGLTCENREVMEEDNNPTQHNICWRVVTTDHPTFVSEELPFDTQVPTRFANAPTSEPQKNNDTHVPTSSAVPAATERPTTHEEQSGSRQTNAPTFKQSVDDSQAPTSSEIPASTAVPTSAAARANNNSVAPTTDTTSAKTEPSTSKPTPTLRVQAFNSVGSKVEPTDSATSPPIQTGATMGQTTIAKTIIHATAAPRGMNQTQVIIVELAVAVGVLFVIVAAYSLIG